MSISFIGQPFDPFGWSADWLKTVLADPRVQSIEIAVAWVKRSGLLRLQDDLVSFQERGGKAIIVTGIDEGGATKQGLRLAREIFSSAYVFHDKSSRTFHPKVYLAKGDEVAYLMIGSNNLTAGGIYNNYEGALACNLNLGDEASVVLFEQVVSWFETIYSDSACKPLDEVLIETLISTRKYKIGDEDRPRREGLEEEDYDGIVTDPQEELFEPSSSQKKRLAPRIRDVREDYNVHRRGAHRLSPQDFADDDTTTEEQIPETTSATPERIFFADAVPMLRWVKKMSSTDAQHPPSGNSNPTGHLKLGKARNNIDHKTFFRYELFRDANWTGQNRSRGLLEEAIIPFKVTIEGKDLGLVNIKVDHADFRIAQQDNTPTWLHWGRLSDYMEVTNYSGNWVIIERKSDGSYVLRISLTAPDV